MSKDGERTHKGALPSPAQLLFLFRPCPEGLVQKAVARFYLTADDDDNLYVATEHNDYRKPIRKRSLFKCKLPYSKVQPFGFVLGTTAYWDEVSKKFFVRDPKDKRAWYLTLAKGRDPYADITDETPIPCPLVSTGVETRWMCGRWQRKWGKVWVNIGEEPRGQNT